MNIETARGFFLWCSVINYAMLLLWVALIVLGRDWLYRTWSKWFRLSSEQFDTLNFAGMTVYKIGIWLFNIVPFIALYLVK